MPFEPPSPELLSPAGNWDCAKAAVANGADAIYFGLPRFNARLRADNFTGDDLPELMDWLHARGTRGFVAMNTLVFTRELEEAAAQLERLEAAKVDAVIIQDLGLAALAARIAPSVEIHASTQMTITSPEGLAFVRGLVPLERAVLARELSLREIERFTRTGGETSDPLVPMEVFVHGALCVAYSGQCLTSEALGQRSANRGECAQACRMPYELLVDGEPINLGDRRYLLSPQDLAAHDQIPDLLARGVVSFKIEGRLKSPEYVAAVTAVYRKALDRAMAGAPAPATTEDRYALEMTFSRGLTPGWLAGTNHPALVHARFGKKRGALLGVIERVGPDWIELDRPALALPEDGIVIDTGGDTNHETGGRIGRVQGRRFQFPADRIQQARPRPGDRIWKTSDPRLDARLRGTWKGRIENRRMVPLDLEIRGQAGEALVVREIRSGAMVASQEPLAAAAPGAAALDADVLRAQFGRLGGTAYQLGNVAASLTDSVSLPLSALNRLRRALVEAVDRARRPARGPALSSKEAMAGLLPALPESRSLPDAPVLSVLARNLEQIEAALDCGITEIHADFEDIRRGKDAVALVRSREQAGASPAAIFLATPRIQKSGEAGYFKLIERARPDGVLLRNLGALGHFRDHDGLRRHGDFSLNIANPITASLLRGAARLDRMTISYDLNINQVLDLLAAAPPSWFELTLHQHMPMFHMEHCVFCVFLSDGTDFTNCGRPCEKHQVLMRDRVGMKHVLQADVGCRNTLFRGQAQTGAQFLPALLKAGLPHYRLELLTENRERAVGVIRLYQDLLAGRANPATAWRTLKATAQLGVTEGTLAG
jgi:putative protease